MSGLHSLGQLFLFLTGSGWELAFKALERIWHTKETIMLIINRIIPNVQSTLQSHGTKIPANQHQIKYPCERTTFKN